MSQAEAQLILKLLETAQKIGAAGHCQSAGLPMNRAQVLEDNAVQAAVRRASSSLR